MNTFAEADYFTITDVSMFSAGTAEQQAAAAMLVKKAVAALAKITTTPDYVSMVDATGAILVVVKKSGLLAADAELAVRAADVALADATVTKAASFSL